MTKIVGFGSKPGPSSSCARKSQARGISGQQRYRPPKTYVFDPRRLARSGDLGLTKHGSHTLTLSSFNVHMTQGTHFTQPIYNSYLLRKPSNPFFFPSLKITYSISLAANTGLSIGGGLEAKFPRALSFKVTCSISLTANTSLSIRGGLEAKVLRAFSLQDNIILAKIEASPLLQNFGLIRY